MTNYKVGDAIVVTSPPMNYPEKVREHLVGRGGIVRRVINTDFEIIIDNRIYTSIWEKRIRIATHEEARGIRLIHNLRRSYHDDIR
jgi:hypothetical protein